MSDEATPVVTAQTPSQFPNHKVIFHGIRLDFVVRDETNGVETEGVLHLQHTGKVGISKPYWAHSHDIAKKAMPILEQAFYALSSVAEDPTKWPNPTQESEGRGQDPVPEPQEE